MIKLMKAIFTFIFLVLSIISYSQKNKENLEEAFNSYLEDVLQESSKEEKT